MNSVIGLRLASGRSTVRSIRTAPAMRMRMVTASAAAKGRPCSSSVTKVSAANSRIEPWAKLKTPLAL